MKHSRTWAWMPAVLCLLLAPACSTSRSAHANDPGFAAFVQKANEYVELQNRLELRVPPLRNKTGPTEIAAHKKALAAAIAMERRDARSGDIFSSSKGHFVEVIRSEVRGHDGQAARKTIMSENKERDPKVDLAVNAEYPENAPLSTVPPSLLLRLPVLPRHIEYRFVGKDLILRDADAGIIVDFIQDALP